jgi:hypothetical protein
LILEKQGYKGYKQAKRASEVSSSERRIPRGAEVHSMNLLVETEAKLPVTQTASGDRLRPDPPGRHWVLYEGDYQRDRDREG